MIKAQLRILIMSALTILLTGSAIADTNTNYLVLVNNNFPLPDGWEKTVSLVETTNKYGEVTTIEKHTLAAFQALQACLAIEGIHIELDSAYRSITRQQELWTQFENEYGLEYTQNTVAVPGTSEHHTGLAVDICLDVNDTRINDNEAMLAEREIFKRIHEHLADFGFILRYLPNKKSITGYSYEPWHLRYIGNVTVAKAISAAGLTLEEYLILTTSLQPGK